MTMGTFQRRFFVGVLGLAIAGAFSTGPVLSAPESAIVSTFDHSHKSWDKVLKAVVKSGLVNYQELKAHPGPLEDYLRILANVSAAEYALWNRNEKLACWINAYNAFTLKVIVDHYPIRPQGLFGFQNPRTSIKQIPGVWSRFQFQTVLGPKTLDEIEHQILRREFREPRIHFAIVCASLGCPELRSEAYAASRLDSQLNDQAVRFFRNPAKIRLDRERGILFLNPILDWFAGDFGDRVKFAERTMSSVDAGWLRMHPVTIQFLSYDWSLNEQP